MTISRFRIAAMDCDAEAELVRMRLADLDGIDRIAILPQVPGRGFQQREEILRMFAEDVMARVG